MDKENYKKMSKEKLVETIVKLSKNKIPRKKIKVAFWIRIKAFICVLRYLPMIIRIVLKLSKS